MVPDERIVETAMAVESLGVVGVLVLLLAFSVWWINKILVSGEKSVAITTKLEKAITNLTVTIDKTLAVLEATMEAHRQEIGHNRMLHSDCKEKVFDTLEEINGRLEAIEGKLELVQTCPVNKCKSETKD